MSEVTSEAIEMLRDDLFHAHARDPQADCPPWVVRRLNEIAPQRIDVTSLADAAFVAAVLATSHDPRGLLRPLALARRVLRVMPPSAPCPASIRTEVQEHLGALPTQRRLAEIADDASVLDVLVLAGQLLTTPRLARPALALTDLSRDPFEF
jgi:hypothetical protein